MLRAKYARSTRLSGIVRRPSCKKGCARVELTHAQPSTFLLRRLHFLPTSSLEALQHMKRASVGLMNMPLAVSRSLTSS